MDRVFLSQDLDMKIHHVMTGSEIARNSSVLRPVKRFNQSLRRYRKGSENKEQKLNRQNEKQVRWIPFCGKATKWRKRRTRRPPKLRI